MARNHHDCFCFFNELGICLECSFPNVSIKCKCAAAESIRGEIRYVQRVYIRMSRTELYRIVRSLDKASMPGGRRQVE